MIRCSCGGRVVRERRGARAKGAVRVPIARGRGRMLLAHVEIGRMAQMLLSSAPNKHVCCGEVGAGGEEGWHSARGSARRRRAARVRAVHAPLLVALVERESRGPKSPLPKKKESTRK